jgi:phosphohistidine swiveling domain-containing protein
LPEKINIVDKNIIVDFWIEKLKKNPFLHDKVEFDVAVTAYDFEIKKKLKNYFPNNISPKTKKKIESLYKDIFIKNINKKSDVNLDKISKKIYYLNLLQKKFSINKSRKKNIENVKLIIKNCKKYGIIPFAQAARHGFIAKGLLDSLVSKKIFSQKRSIELQKVVNTVTSNFLEDINLVKKKILTKSFFFRKYGHLRPGAYDITSKNYREMKNIFFEKAFKVKKHKFKLNTKEQNKLNVLLNKEKIDLNHESLINYIIGSIELREFSKFIFSKSIDNIFRLLIKIVPKKLKNKEIVSFFSINEILNDKASIKLFLKRKNEYENNIKIFLPEVINDSKAYDVIPYMFNVPNFITNNRVIGKVINLSNKLNYSLENKIILIENADPGFDWIFTKKIKGFATQFGGANSHMAIRAAELNIPAVIGCGQKNFDELKNSLEIEIDCLNKKTTILK